MCKRFRIIILNILIVLHVRTTLSTELQFDALKKQRIIEKQSRGIMSPKIDYDEWTPLGRGDPLKNDPTFDYSPPMVSKVKYWINPSLRTPDPPIVPNRDYTTESNQYTAIVSTSTKSANSIPKQPASDIKRFYVDYKDPVDTGYVQLLNSKYTTNNNKVNRPQQFQHQNHFYSPTRQPPPPLPMLVPPPAIEPTNYSFSKIENSTILEFSWDRNNHHMTSTATTSTPVLTTLKVESRPEAKITSEKASSSVLQNLLGKERSTYYGKNPTTMTPLTPNPVPFTLKQNTAAPKPPTYLIIQGHSKVKKYGGAGKLEKADVFLQDTNEIKDIFKYELPKDVRRGKQLNLEDFLPLSGGAFRETLKDIFTNQAEGSGFGAELTKAIFPSYIRPSTTLVYESPRLLDYSEDRVGEGEKDLSIES